MGHVFLFFQLSNYFWLLNIVDDILVDIMDYIIFLWRLLIFIEKESTFFIIFIYFNWRLITLQYCSGFCHTLTWISHGCTCVPHPELPLPVSCPYHPSGLSQCTSPENPVSCIKPGLAIYFTYGDTHFSMLFSQIIPPLPSPTESKSLFFTSVLIKSQLLWTQTSNHLLCSGTELHLFTAV